MSDIHARAAELVIMLHQRARDHADRLNALLVGYLAWTVLTGQPDSTRAMPFMRNQFGDWLETRSAAERGVRGVGGLG